MVTVSQLSTYLITGLAFTLAGGVLLYLAKISPSDSRIGQVYFVLGFAFVLIGLLDLGPHALLYDSWPWPVRTN